MKRAFLAITGTIAGLVALLGFKSHTVQFTAAPPPGGALQSGPPTTRSTAAGHRSATQRFVGPAGETPYGIVQVAVRVAGRHITAVTLPRLDAFDATSHMINSQAAPILLHETKAAQSAQINTVSGATYTSEGYLQSLQSALNKAGL